MQDEGEVSERERVRRLESRLSALELRLVTHAEDLKFQISERVLRIQSRIESALRPFQAKAERKRLEEDADNVVDFSDTQESGEPRDKHQLYARNAREAMMELNDTLRVTREHLEALSGSIQRMKKSVGSR